MERGVAAGTPNDASLDVLTLALNDATTALVEGSSGAWHGNMKKKQTEIYR